MREIITSAFEVLVLKSFGASLAFGFNVLLGRLLGATGAGVYYMALTVTTFAVVIGKAGMDNVLLRFASSSAAQRNWAEVAGVARQGLLIAASLSALATAVTFLLTPWLACTIFKEPALILPLQIMSLSIIPQSLLILYGELLRALNRIRDSVLVQAVGVPLMSIVLLVVLVKIEGVAGAVEAYLAASCLVMLFGVVQWRRATPQLRGFAGAFDTRLLVSTSLPLFWVALLNLVTGSASDRIILGILANSTTVGIYSVASATAGLTSFVLLALNTVIAPKFAILYTEANYEALGTLARNGARVGALVSALPLALFVFAPSQILTIFGAEFSQGATILTILGIGQFVHVAAGSTGYLLIMTGHEKAVRNNVLLNSLLNVLLLILLVPYFGAVGAAAATTTSLVLLNLVSCLLVYKYVSIRVW